MRSCLCNAAYGAPARFALQSSSARPGHAPPPCKIPSEVWRKSESSLKVLWKLMRVMWVRMSEESEDDQMPEDWIDATLVCLYKGKVRVWTQKCTEEYL